MSSFSPCSSFRFEVECRSLVVPDVAVVHFDLSFYFVSLSVSSDCLY